MAKSHVNLLAGKLASAPDPEPFGLGDWAVLAAGKKVPPGFPAGDIAPVGIPDGESRQWLRAKIAEDLAKWDHETLARLAAHLWEGSMLWRGVFAHYAKDKEIELRQTKADLTKALHDAQKEFLEVLDDPGTRAYLNAKAKAARDPASARKPEVKQLWQERKDGKHPDLYPNWKFASECVRRWGELKQTTIERNWIPEWEKESRSHAAS